MRRLRDNPLFAAANLIHNKRLQAVRNGIKRLRSLPDKPRGMRRFQDTQKTGGGGGVIGNASREREPLLRHDCLHQISRSIHIHAVKNSRKVCEQLQGHDLQQR